MNEATDIYVAINRDERQSVPAGAMHSLMQPSLDPLFWPAERVGQPSAWWLHVPFAHWIVPTARPRLLVELGTHTGVSYSAFCQAVHRSGLPTRCHSVDTWQGDEHAGRYDESVFQEFNAYNTGRFADFSTLMRGTFDEALKFFEDGSIDLLHIDGLHTYEAVHHDFESWLPKLSQSAVVLLHDINVRTNNFGVWRLWEELRSRYPAFEFLHGFGLGVLAVGENAPAQVVDLCNMTDPHDIAAIRSRFFRLGERWLNETRELELQASTAATRLQQADVAAAASTASKAEVAELREAHRIAASEQEKLQAQLAESQHALAVAQQAAAAAAGMQSEANRAQADADAARQELATVRTGLEDALAQAKAAAGCAQADAGSARSEAAKLQARFEEELARTTAGLIAKYDDLREQTAAAAEVHSRNEFRLRDRWAQQAMSSRQKALAAQAEVARVHVEAVQARDEAIKARADTLQAELKASQALMQASEAQEQAEHLIWQIRHLQECDQATERSRKLSADALEQVLTYTAGIARDGGLTNTWPLSALRSRPLRSLLRQANAERAARHFSKASTLYENYLRLVPGNGPIHVQCAHMHKEVGNLRTAELHYLCAKALMPHDDDLALQLGHFYKVAGRKAEALSSYMRAVDLRPGWPEALREVEALQVTQERS